MDIPRWYAKNAKPKTRSLRCTGEARLRLKVGEDTHIYNYNLNDTKVAIETVQSQAKRGLLSYSAAHYVSATMAAAALSFLQEHPDAE